MAGEIVFYKDTDEKSKAIAELSDIFSKTVGEDGASDYARYAIESAIQEVVRRRYPFLGQLGLTQEKAELIALPPGYTMVCIRIAEYLFNKQGAIGELAHSETGTSRTYESGDIPRSLTWTILPMAYVPGEGGV